jgi:hypothetical protein
VGLAVCPRYSPSGRDHAGYGRSPIPCTRSSRPRTPPTPRLRAARQASRPRSTNRLTIKMRPRLPASRSSRRKATSCVLAAHRSSLTWDEEHRDAVHAPALAGGGGPSSKTWPDALRSGGSGPPSSSEQGCCRLRGDIGGIARMKLGQPVAAFELVRRVEHRELATGAGIRARRDCSLLSELDPGRSVPLLAQHRNWAGLRRSRHWSGVRLTSKISAGASESCARDKIPTSATPAAAAALPESALRHG